ncbi:ribosome-associated translation inhibitor RaiA [Helicobacter sp. MIT 05-5294]|uniref:ribosome hibernation-promoting factor, HPF/YfiA family n=1 Tax=Helicobacter sp. MIT 05-5294 TaxID=1548150 RepID=UPI00051FAAA1|nr:ribosome-associated translation inhibitor RaiA [Helicobacter sp. MIT 05-5294]TLD85643.1 ribosome-associated translation inhibitor RaiA [Helicobacter sp. MIT 05-5294]
MHTIITSRHFELTDSIKDYILQLTKSLEKYNLEILSTRVVISHQEKKGNKKGEKKKKRLFSVDITLALAHTNTLVISQSDKDLYAAADLAVARMHKILRRYHDKIHHKQAIPSETIMASGILRDEALADKGGDEIVPMDLDLHKPLDIEDALERLKSSSQQFFVFNDKDSKMRVIYKRIDGKYGLY